MFMCPAAVAIIHHDNMHTLAQQLHTDGGALAHFLVKVVKEAVRPTLRAARVEGEWRSRAMTS